MNNFGANNELKGTIFELTPENYDKCQTIWDMKTHAKHAEYFYRQLIAGNRRIFVYEEDGVYLGEGALVFDQGDPEYTIPGKRVYLSRMIVAPQRRGQGIGQKLLHHLFGVARGLNYAEISIGVDISNIGARWLYEKNGFTQVIFVGEDADGKYVKLLKTL